MTLRVVVPPHPLIAHWLTMLRNATTPSPLYATGLKEIGRWLTYEALREWLPYRKEEVKTYESVVEGMVIETNVAILAIPIRQGGYELLNGAREVLPNCSYCYQGVPKCIEDHTGLIIFIDQIASGNKLLEVLSLIKEKKVESKRIRIITALASSPGLTKLGEIFPDINIYTTCIDPELTENKQIKPGIGDPTLRLNTRIGTANYH